MPNQYTIQVKWEGGSSNYMIKFIIIESLVQNCLRNHY